MCTIERAGRWVWHAATARVVVRIAPALLAVTSLCACGPREVRFDVRVVASDCSGAEPGGLEGVRFLEVSVIGPGLEKPVAASSPVDAAGRSVELPRIPAGAERIVVVRGFDGDPAASGSRTVSIGRSTPFTVPETLPAEGAGGPRRLTVFLRRLGALTPVASASDPSQCASLATARAAHTATLLESGKVLLAGGFALEGSGARVALAGAELFDPGSGTFERGPALSVAQGRVVVPKAFHTATHLKSDQVLLWGGEYYDQTDAGVVTSTSAVGLVFDPEAMAYGVVSAPDDGRSVERTQHGAAIEANGKVLLAGGLIRHGVSPELAPAEHVQWFDPVDALVRTVKTSDGAPSEGALSEPRVAAGIVSVQRDRAVAVAGGANGAQLVRELALFRFEGGAFRRETEPLPRLAGPGRRGPLAVAPAEGNELLLLGGHGDALHAAPLGTSEIIDLQAGTVRAGPSVAPVVDGCAVGLPDGRIFVAGGRALEGGALRSRGETALLRRGEGGTWAVSAGPPLPSPLHWHACTLLRDGTVLISGGLSEPAGSEASVGRAAWIYQPPEDGT